MKIVHKNSIKNLLITTLISFASLPVFSSDILPPTSEEIFTRSLVSIPMLVEQEIEYSAVIYAGKTCKLFADTEIAYWNKLWPLSIEVLLNPRDQKQLSNEVLSLPNMNKMEKRSEYFLKQGCGTPELAAKIRDMKKRMRLSGFALKQVTEANDAALMDLFKEPQK